ASDAGVREGRARIHAHTPWRPAAPDHRRMDRARGNAVHPHRRRGMAADAALIARLDELIALFNRKGMDVPDGLFDRRTAFVLNGDTFEALLGRPSPDPLVLMLTRGNAGFRFAAKSLQHA